MEYYLAVDIGASSGRHILSYVENGRIRLEEIYRFENGMVERNGHLCWELDRLFSEILNGLKKCKEVGKIPASMGIDTWAVDYVLLDKEGKCLGETYGYRDSRTIGMDEKVYEIISEESLYKRTGIQKQIFNTIYQLMSVKVNNPQCMEGAEQLLLIPDYFNYLLTGRIMTEYTNATTTQMVSPKTHNWDMELIEMLGYKKEIFGGITMAGTQVGPLKSNIADEIGFNLQVIQTATHDTASAIVAVPVKDSVYISSGTWSLMGVEQEAINCSKASHKGNFTNEGGYQYKYRFLKNIMGLWMIQSVRHEWKDEYSFEEICAMAEKYNNFPSRIDVNDSMFLAPESMVDAVKEYCRKNNKPVPMEKGEIAATIYQSLALFYGNTVLEIEAITGKKYDSINIIGGGSNAEYLNMLTAKATGRTVYSGPAEATALGNILVQMLEKGVFNSVDEAREAVYKSFSIKCIKEER